MSNTQANPRGRQAGFRVRWHEIAALTLILAAGCLLRWSYLREVARSPEFRFPLVDAAINDYWARGMATGDWSLPPQAEGVDPEIGTHSYFRPPGYPLFLAL